MKHVMNLHSVPFEMIRSGRKTIELRLYDEKRRLISVGDEIEFVNSSDRRACISCLVVALHKFDSFKDLYEGLPLLKCGYTTDNINAADPSDMEEYYSPEEQKAYGVVGIEISKN